MNIEQIKKFIKGASASHGELTTLRESGSVDQKEYDEKSQQISHELKSNLQEVKLDALINDDNFHENIPGLNQEVTYYKLLTEVDFINNFGNLVGNGDGIEDAISLIFNADETTIKITHLFQKYMTEDLKSDLTEEFAWIYDYIRNIASEEEKNELLDHLKEINNSKLTGKDATTHLRGLLIPIKKSINANQLNNGLHVPFYFQNVEDRKDIVDRANDDVDLDDVNSAMDLFKENADKNRGFKKASGGLPDVVSINPKTDKVNFTAANSLSSLTMESDQLERHSAMIALAISLCKEYPKDFSKNLNKVTEDKKNITDQRDLYFSMWYGEPEFQYDNEVIDLVALKEIWKNEIDITFFQTYTSKNVVPVVANDFVIRNNSNIKSTRDTYRKINERTRAILANSQTIANEQFTSTVATTQKYPSEAISYQAQNNKSNSKTIKPVNENMLDFKNDILKIDNIGEHLQQLVALPHKEKDNPKMRGVDFAMESGLDNMDKDALTKFFSDDVDKEKNVVFRKSKIDMLNNVVIPYLKNDTDGTKHLEKTKLLNNKGFIDDDYIGDLGVIVNNNTARIKESIKDGDKKNPIQQLDEDKEYTLTDLSLINMLGSSDLLRTSALVNIAIVYRDEYKKSKNPILLTKLEELKSYSIRSLSSFGQDTSSQIGSIVGSVREKEDDKPQPGQENYNDGLDVIEDPNENNDDSIRDFKRAIKKGFPIKTILENEKIPEKIKKYLIKAIYNINVISSSENGFKILKSLVLMSENAPKDLIEIVKSETQGHDFLSKIEEVLKKAQPTIKISPKPSSKTSISWDTPP